MIDFNSSSNFNERINYLIDNAPHKEEPARKYLGASIIGHPCERHVQYQAVSIFYPEHSLKKPFDARTRRILDRGHLLEDYAAKVLRNAGMVLMTEQDGQQISCEWFDGKIKGHLDGIVVSSSKHHTTLALPSLWEHKARNDSNFKKFLKEKVKNIYPQYYAQTLFYMEYHGLKDTLFTFTNANTMEMAHQRVVFDQKDFDYYYERTDRVLTYLSRGEWVAKVEKETSITCRFCDFSKDCWS